MAIFKTANGHGKYQDDTAREGVLCYITDPSKTLSRQLVMYHHVDPSNPARTMQTTAQYYHKDSRVRLRHIILGYRRDEVDNPWLAYQIASELAPYFAKDFEMVIAVHDDSDFVNTHIVFNAIRFTDGSRFRGTRDEHGEMFQFCHDVHKKYGIVLEYASNKIWHPGDGDFDEE